MKTFIQQGFFSSACYISSFVTLSSESRASVGVEDEPSRPVMSDASGVREPMVISSISLISCVSVSVSNISIDTWAAAQDGGGNAA